ncbi:terminase small subunit-like protein [Pseudochrobactrum lubricantis]|uniref:terminase small subunit-like protein n=1 Tax=Pseudochrobactrum lubricantis TaxID=558172 RepID=UPI0035DC854C
MSIPPDRVKQIADKAEARAGQQAKIGRPSDYTEAMASHICAEMSAGRSLRSICEDTDMPDRVTVFRWLARHKEFRNQYARAQEDRASAMAEDILDIADDEECPDVQKAKLRIDTRKWLMSKMAPKRYGDKQQMQLTGAEGEDGTPTAIQVTIVDPKR